VESYVKRIQPKILAYGERKPQLPFQIKRLSPELGGGRTFGYYGVAHLTRILAGGRHRRVDDMEGTAS
jgi:hypothetical protein